MFKIEEVSRKAIKKLYKNTELDELTIAKAEYGLSLLLGITIDTVVCLSVALLLGTFKFTLFILLASLIIRIFSGGAHCTSFFRCLIFTVGLYSILAIYGNYFINNYSLNYIDIHILLLLLLSVLFLRKSRMIVLILLLLSISIYLLVGEKTVDIWFALSLGIFSQAVMHTKSGGDLVNLIDKLLKKLEF